MAVGLREKAMSKKMGKSVPRKKREKSKPLARVKKDKVKDKEKEAVVDLVEALSTQPNAPLHFGMELSLCSNFVDPKLRPINSSSDPNEKRFLTVSHPDGHTQVLRHSLIRAGAGEYRGGIEATHDKGPTDVAVFKVRTTHSEKNLRV
jgi:hypothetical protein